VVHNCDHPRAFSVEFDSADAAHSAIAAAERAVRDIVGP
jgi:hypothetical protein